ncbi:MAG TPA: DNA topology modulation protein [Pyrinomonadaceae bacterium]|jgi:adenylate kinase family enzyme
MKKVLVIGSGGAGKSTFARRLGLLLNIEVVHLDMLYWQPGWVELPKPEWRQMVEELTEREAWIMDGNYSGTLDVRFAACDTLIFLDLPRLVCLRRIIRRRAAYRRRNRPDMAAGCHERLTLEFVRWVWNYPQRSRPKILALFKEHAHHKRMIRLRSPAEVERFLADLARTVGATAG